MLKKDVENQLKRVSFIMNTALEFISKVGYSKDFNEFLKQKENVNGKVK
tara:strand:+ start:3461 stop:3607 length:147 start_codon:yes stop_codon:yes gene_type:complete